MDPITVGIAAGALNLFGGLAQNSAIRKQAAANWNSNLLSLGQQRAVSEANLKDKGQDVVNAVGMQLTELAFEERRQLASTTVESTERNIYGATATKLRGQVEMEGALMADNIAQAGEAAMKDVQINLTNTMYQYNSGVQQASIQRANTLNQQKGFGELLGSSAQAGFSFASGYNSMMGK